MDVALPPDNAWTLMLSIGIEYGAFHQNGKLEQVKRFGAAKIMALQGNDGTPEEDRDDDVPETDGVQDVDVDVMSEEVPPVAVQPESTATASPKLRYVYTTKVETTERQTAGFYYYTLPIAVREETQDAGTTQQFIALAPVIPGNATAPNIASVMISRARPLPPRRSTSVPQYEIGEVDMRIQVHLFSDAIAAGLYTAYG